jgi:hypothetical protein
MGYERTEDGGWLVWHDGQLIGKVWRIGHRAQWIAADVAGNERGIYRTRREAAEGLREEQG